MPPELPTPHRVKQDDQQILSDGHFRLEKLTLASETFAGSMPTPVTREVLRSGRSVAVLLYDPSEHSFILTEQFRIGAYLNRLPSPWLLETVAGMVDDGEAPETSARREIEEETGCKVSRIERIGEFLTSPGITDELITIYIAAANAKLAGGVHGKASEAEDICTRILSVDQAFAEADNGGIVNIVTQLALLWFSRHGTALRERWLDPAHPAQPA